MDSYFLGSKIGKLTQTTNQGGNQQGSSNFGRVIKIALDDSTLILDAQGNTLPIGTILYRDITAEKETQTTEYPALPLHTNIKQFPLLNEVVALMQGPTSDIMKNVGNSDMYYSTVVNLWGSSHHNALPEPNTDISVMLGNGVEELSDINPMYPFPGDILIEGRQGQSIRIGGYKSKENPLVNNLNNTKPYTIISNGQIKTDNGIDHIVEDINRDANSIYLLSDHKVPLIPANEKRDSYNTPPISSDKYTGNQIAINADRIYINARNENVLISSKQSIGLNAQTLNFDAKEYTCIDADYIYLGKKARSSPDSVKEPAVLGNQLDNFLSILLDTLQNIGQAMIDAQAQTGGPIASLNTEGYCVIDTVTALQTLLGQKGPMKSKKVFIE